LSSDACVFRRMRKERKARARRHCRSQSSRWPSFREVCQVTTRGGAARQYAPADGSLIQKSRRIYVRLYSPYISGGRRWLSCRQPACQQPGQRHHGTDGRTHRAVPKCPLRRGIVTQTHTQPFNGPYAVVNRKRKLRLLFS